MAIEIKYNIISTLAIGDETTITNWARRTNTAHSAAAPPSAIRAAAASRGTTVASRQGPAAAHFLPIFSKFSSNGSGSCSLGKGPSLNVVWTCSGLQHSGFKCL